MNNRNRKKSLSNCAKMSVAIFLCRISCAGELLAHIRTVKMYSWDKLFTQRLNKRRELEVKHLAVCSCLLAILKFLSSCIFGTRTHRCFFSWQTRKYLDAWCVYFWATTPTLFSLFTFSIFAIMGHSLDAATVKQYLELYVWNMPSGLGVWQTLHTWIPSYRSSLVSHSSTH